MSELTQNILPAYSARTTRQAEVFEFIDQYFGKYRKIPSCREMARHFGWASYNASAVMIRRLIAAGLVVQRPVPGGGVVRVPAGRRIANSRK